MGFYNTVLSLHALELIGRQALQVPSIENMTKMFDDLQARLRAMPYMVTETQSVSKTFHTSPSTTYRVTCIGYLPWRDAGYRVQERSIRPPHAQDVGIRQCIAWYLLHFPLTTMP